MWKAGCLGIRVCSCNPRAGEAETRGSLEDCWAVNLVYCRSSRPMRETLIQISQCRQLPREDTGGFSLLSTHMCTYTCVLTRTPTHTWMCTYIHAFTCTHKKGSKNRWTQSLTHNNICVTYTCPERGRVKKRWRKGRMRLKTHIQSKSLKYVHLTRTIQVTERKVQHGIILV